MTQATPPPPDDRRLGAEAPPPFWGGEERLDGLYALGMTGVVLLFTAPWIAAFPVASAITLAVPVSLGVLAGSLAPSAHAITLLGVLFGGIGMVVAVLWLREVAGVFCAFIYAIAAFGPGMLAGLLVLGLRRRVAWYRRIGKRALGALLLVVPLLVHAAERTWPATHAPERIVVAREFAAPVDRVFAQSLHFGEDAASPWEAIHAPLPRQALGRASAVGDVKTIVFGKGVITVRVVAVEPGRRLVAEVIEQTIERRALLLSTVTVTCEPLGPARTRVQLQLDFVPCMGPRWYWRWFEAWFGGIAFDAVLEAWQRAAAGGQAAAAGDCVRNAAGTAGLAGSVAGR